MGRRLKPRIDSVAGRTYKISISEHSYNRIRQEIAGPQNLLYCTPKYEMIVHHTTISQNLSMQRDLVHRNS
jgi:hypothetical protein